MDVVSIVIPVFNGAEYLADAIDSALAQTWPHTEVIVVDDGSDDDGRTRAIAESYGDRIRLVTKPNGGVATALNAGVAAMRGKWFSWLSHDDLYVPQKVETQLRALHAIGGDAIAFSDFELMDAVGVPIAVRTVTENFNPDQPLWAVLEGRLNGCAMMIPRTMLDTADGFDPGLPTTQDYALWFQLLRHHRALPVPGVLVRQRVHAAQGSRHESHLVEAGLLWAEMVTTVTPEEMQRHAANEMAFLRRIALGANASAYPGATEAIRTCINRRLRDVRIGLVWVSDGAPNEGPHRAQASITTAGLDSADAMVVDASRGAHDSLALRAMIGHTLPVLRLWPAASSDALLEAAAMLDAAIVVIASEAVPVLPTPLRDAAAMIVAGEADGVMPSSGLQGAILSMDAVRAAVARRALSTALSAGEALAQEARLVALPDDRPTDACAPVTAPAVPTKRDLSPLTAWTLHLAERLHGRLPFAKRRIGPAVASAFMKPGSLDPAAYLETYPDVRAAGADPHLHYLLHGQWEGRSPRPSAETESSRPSLAAAYDGPCRLLILHNLGGGTRRFVDMRATALRRQGIVPILAWGGHDREITFEGLPGVDDLRSVPLTEGHGEALGLLQGLAIDRVEVFHTIGLDVSIMPLLAALGRPHEVTLLDYHLIASQPHLLDDAGNTAALGDEEEAVRVLLRAAPHPVLNDAVSIQACSRDLAERVMRLVPGLAVTVAPPPERPVPERFRVRQPRLACSEEPLRVLFLGDLALHKGSETLLGAAAETAQRGLPIEFHQLGRLHGPLPFQRQSPRTLCINGRFDQDQLPALVATIRPHLAWFPAMAPETYGFALSDAMLLGLPILARGLGAYPERLAGRAYSWVVPATSDNSPSAWVERLMALRARGLPDDPSLLSELV